MAMSSRDDFNVSIKRKLRDRVGGRCSHPACRVPTVAASSDEDGVAIIGVAAHITAAATGGPRYDASLTPQQRGAFKNGIWLCQNHATEIDHDKTGHPEKLLREWKQKAETTARLERGQKLPDHDDAINTVTAALTASSSKSVPSAVRNVHLATNRALQSLDSRFRVESSFANGLTQFNISAQEPVALSISFDSAKVPDIPSKLNELFAKGMDFEVDASAVTIRGSPLFDLISTDTFSGKFGVTIPRKRIRLKSWIQYSGKAERHYFDDMDGEMVAGTESVRADARGWNDVLAISLIVPRESLSRDARVELTADFQPWNGVDVTRLSYFDSLNRLIEYLVAGANLYVSVEVDGNAILTSNAVDISKEEWLNYMSTLLEYIKLARSLASKINVSIVFAAEREITKENYHALVDTERIATGQFKIAKAQIKSNPRITITASGDITEVLMQAEGQQVIQIQDQLTPPIKVFGQMISLPNRTTTLSPVHIKLPEQQKHVAASEKIVVELVMLDNFEFSMVFQNLR